MAITKKTTAKESVKKVASKIVEKIMPKTKKKETSVKVESKKPAPVSTKAKGTKVKKEEPKKAGLKKTEVKKAETKKVAVKKEAAKKETVKKVESKKTSTSKKEEAAHSFAPEYLVMMQKDPNWLQAFWEVADSRLKKVKAGKEKLVLRLFDSSSDSFCPTTPFDPVIKILIYKLLFYIQNI